MSANLRIGDQVETDVTGRKTLHSIVARKVTAETRSGISYRLLPAVDPEWIDAHKVRKAHGFGRAVDRTSDPFADEVNA